jgi:hypothetical protein
LLASPIERFRLTHKPEIRLLPMGPMGPMGMNTGLMVTKILAFCTSPKGKTLMPDK